MTEHGWEHDDAVGIVNSGSTHKKSIQNKLPMGIRVIIDLILLVFVLVIGLVYLNRAYNSVKDTLANALETVEIQ